MYFINQKLFSKKNVGFDTKKKTINNAYLMKKSKIMTYIYIRFCQKHGI